MKDESLDFEVDLHSRSPRMGRSTIEARCPFCLEWLTVYVWSISGSGKRCDCGAVLRMSSTVGNVARKPVATRV